MWLVMLKSNQPESKGLRFFVNLNHAFAILSRFARSDQRVRDFSLKNS